MTLFRPYPIAFSMLALLSLGVHDAKAQQRGEIESQTYEIVKEKSIEFPVANRLYSRVELVSAPETKSKVSYRFVDPKLLILSPKFIPQAVAPSDEKKRKDLPKPLHNYIKLGGGNYGRFLGDAFVSARASDDLVFTLNATHNSSASGPVQTTLSGNSLTQVKMGGKYILNSNKLDAGVGYTNQNFTFYGFRPQPEVEVRKDSIRQAINTVDFNIGFENTDASTAVDYSLKTALYSLRDRYNASEFDWGTSLKVALPVSNSVYALLDADAFISQRVDDFTYNRNFFRVKPYFKFQTDQLAVTIGVNAVNETDNTLSINRTRAFPVALVDFSPTSSVHIFAGYDGDIQRNTLRSLLAENQWLGANVLVANTERTRDIFAGVKGEIEGGFLYEARVGVANYRNFYFFNNMYTDSSKFAVLYEPLRTRVLTISAQAGYSFGELAKTSLRANYFDYGLDRIEEAWHRPTFTLTWNNSLTLSKKLFVTSDLFLLNGIHVKNFNSGMTTKLPTILDLNFKIDYLLTRNFAAYVSLNNVLGKTYQRYQYYPQQGINFVGGLSFSF